MNFLRKNNMLIYHLFIISFFSFNINARSILQTPLYFNDSNFDSPSAARDMANDIPDSNYLATTLKFSYLSNDSNSIGSKSYLMNLVSKNSLSINSEFDFVDVRRKGSNLFSRFSPVIDFYYGNWSDDDSLLISTKFSHREKIFSEISELQKSRSQSFGISVTKDLKNRFFLSMSYLLDFKKVNTIDNSTFPAKINSRSSQIISGLGYKNNCTLHYCPFSSELVFKHNNESEDAYFKYLKFSEIYVDLFSRKSFSGLNWGIGLSNSFYFYNHLKENNFFESNLRLQYKSNYQIIETYYKYTFKPSIELANSQYFIKKSSGGLKLKTGIFEIFYFGFMLEKSVITNQMNNDKTNDFSVGFTMDFKRI